MQLTTILSGLALALTASANPLSRRQETQCTIIANNVASLPDYFSDPTSFCRWYTLGRGRVRSPISALNAAELFAACECHLQDLGIPYPADFGQGNPGHLKPSTPCNQDSASSISAGFTEDVNFCVFFTLVARGFSPMPALAVQDVLQGCQCILGGGSTTVSSSSAPTSVPVTPTSSSNSTTSASTSSSTSAPVNPTSSSNSTTTLPTSSVSMTSTNGTMSVSSTSSSSSDSSSSTTTDAIPVTITDVFTTSIVTTLPVTLTTDELSSILETLTSEISGTIPVTITTDIDTTVPVTLTDTTLGLTVTTDLAETLTETLTSLVPTSLPTTITTDSAITVPAVVTTETIVTDGVTSTAIITLAAPVATVVV